MAPAYDLVPAGIREIDANGMFFEHPFVLRYHFLRPIPILHLKNTSSVGYLSETTDHILGSDLVVAGGFLRLFSELYWTG